MNQNKTTKYFKYAIGEIILVVIGILIALQINNWNEDKKALRQEKQLYVKILANLEDELKLFQDAENTYKEHNDVHYNLYNTSIGKASYDSTLRYGVLRWNVSFAPTFKDSYQNKVDLISNDSISSAMLNYFRVQDQTETVVKLYETSKATVLRPYITENNIMNLDEVFSKDRHRYINPKFSIDYNKLSKHLNKQEFIHVLTDLKIKTEAGLRNIDNLRLANKELRDIIKKYLNK